MSLAMYAAPFNENENDNNIVYKKKQTHNKTQKRITKEYFDTDSESKKKSILKKIKFMLYTYG